VRTGAFGQVLSRERQWCFHERVTAASPSPWRRVDSDVVHSTPWFTVRRDAVVRPDGAPDVYQHVIAPGAVTVLALRADGQVAMTRQWIYTHGSTQWRLPGGGIDPCDADPLSAARRELAEETGLRASEWTPIGRIHGADSLSNHVDHAFLATGLTQGTADPGGGEVDLAVSWLPFDEAVNLVTAGQVPHAGSAFALLSLAVMRVRDGGPASGVGMQ
jgi:8-oxo-dGTP pyrophosphatase MutT (NUDIX family)